MRRKRNAIKFLLQNLYSLFKSVCTFNFNIHFHINKIVVWTKTPSTARFVRTMAKKSAQYQSNKQICELFHLSHSRFIQFFCRNLNTRFMRARLAQEPTYTTHTLRHSNFNLSPCYTHNGWKAATLKGCLSSKLKYVLLTNNETAPGYTHTHNNTMRVKW